MLCWITAASCSRFAYAPPLQPLEVPPPPPPTASFPPPSSVASFPPPTVVSGGLPPALSPPNPVTATPDFRSAATRSLLCFALMRTNGLEATVPSSSMIGLSMKTWSKY
ncbi:hypothetical protein Salat_0072900 [Sesamum alatum]|uniref:Uncharacterized protein n=1 Tax=Sesamum alatum TaxID=300844 RepID=A0AAE2CWU6_9LAMI|nr:hypothetical protein Salat_0072900 [Sesamum alatum]